MTRLLVDMKRVVLREVNASARPSKPKIILGMVIGLTVLVGAGTASVAIAQNSLRLPSSGSPEAAPPTPTASLRPSPSSTPSVAPPINDFVSPISSVPLDCAELGGAGGVDAVVPAPTLVDLEVFTPEAAALRQAGVLSCQWFGEGDYVSLSIDVSADVESGRSYISSLIESGLESPAIGDSSALTCGVVDAGCAVSFVTGGYWFEVRYDGPAVSDGSVVSVIGSFAERAGREVSGLTPRVPWEMPPNSWRPADGCEALTTTPPMSTVIASPALGGPDPLVAGTRNGIVQTQADIFECRWATPEANPLSPGPVTMLTVEIAPGARWAYDQSGSIEATPAEVVGAQDAMVTCQSAEGPACWLDVLVDDSWMQLGYGDSFTPDEVPYLVSAAEAIISRP